MKIGSVSRILIEDLEKVEKVPGWVKPMVEVLNNFITIVGQALKNQLTFADNFNAREVVLEVTHDKPLSINTQSRLKVKGMIPVDGGGLFIDSWGFTRNQDGTIAVKFKFENGTATTKSTVTFELLF